MHSAITRTFRYLARSRSLSFATVVVMSSTFFVTGLFVVAAYSSHVLLDFFESKAQVNAFFVDEATEAEILSIKTSLESTGLIEEIVFTSKEEALQIYIGRFNEDPALLESIAANILPASLDIRAKDIAQLPNIAELLKKEPLVEDVSFHEDIIERLRSLTRGARLLQLILVALQIVSSTFIVLITIALIIHSRRDEIEIMHLVGASKWQIRWPFILQGVIYGVVAALVSSVIMVASLPQIIPYLENTLIGSVSLQIVSTQLFAAIILGQLALGILLGGLGSLWATWKFLK